MTQASSTASALNFTFDACLRPWRLEAARAPRPHVALLAWMLVCALLLAGLYASPKAYALLAVFAHMRGLSATRALGLAVVAAGLAFDLLVRWLLLSALAAWRRRPRPLVAAVAPAVGIGLGVLPGIAWLLAAGATGLNSDDRPNALHWITLAVLFYMALALLQHALQLTRWLGTSRLLGAGLGLLVWGATLGANSSLPSASGQVRAFVADGVSMAPTLVAGDRMLVELHRQPRLGDIVIVRAPDGGEVARRVVGLAGDRVTFDGAGCVHDGSPAAQIDLEPAGDVCPDCVTRGEQLGGHRYRIAGSMLRIFDTPEIVTVPASQVYIVGDYRDRRSDALHRGPVPLESIVGVAFVRYGSPERQGDLTDS